MRYAERLRTPFTRRPVVAALAALCGLLAAGPGRAADPVEELRQTLKAPTEDLAARDREVKQRLAMLRTVSELRRALVLGEWRDDDLEAGLAAVDLPNRAALARRFEAGVGRPLPRRD